MRRSKMPSTLLEHTILQIGAPVRPCALATLTIASIQPPHGWEFLGEGTWPSPRFQIVGQTISNSDFLWGLCSASTTAMRTGLYVN